MNTPFISLRLGKLERKVLQMLQEKFDLPDRSGTIRFCIRKCWKHLIFNKRRQTDS